MNWTQTALGFGALVAASFKATQQRIQDAFEKLGIPRASDAAAEQSMLPGAPVDVTIGGVTMAQNDWWVMAVLTVFCATIAAGVRFGKNKVRDPWSLVVNIALGFIFGVTGAIFLVKTTFLTDVSLFSLAPACALPAAKFARFLIDDDAAVKSILMFLGRIFGGTKG